MGLENVCLRQNSVLLLLLRGGLKEGGGTSPLPGKLWKYPPPLKLEAQEERAGRHILLILIFWNRVKQIYKTEFLVEENTFKLPNVLPPLCETMLCENQTGSDTRKMITHVLAMATLACCIVRILREETGNTTARNLTNINMLIKLFHLI